MATLCSSALRPQAGHATIGAAQPAALQRRPQYAAQHTRKPSNPSGPATGSHDFGSGARLVPKNCRTCTKNEETIKFLLVQFQNIVAGGIPPFSKVFPSTSQNEMPQTSHIVLHTFQGLLLKAKSQMSQATWEEHVLIRANAHAITQSQTLKATGKSDTFQAMVEVRTKSQTLELIW